ncbi:MAG: hypothetical protein ACSHX6_16065 [Akkermansiaceae bacterium]
MKMKPKYLLLGCVLISSCKETSDVSYEREAIKFEAERDAAKSQLVAKETQIKELRSELNSVRAELATRPEAGDAEASGIQVDADKVRLGLMNEVDKLQKTIETQKTDIKVRNYSLGKVEIDTDFPFNATVIMNIYSSTKNAPSTLYWDAKGNLSGEWVLSNTGKENTQENPSQVASNSTQQGNPATTPTTPQQQPQASPQPQPKAQPTIQARPGEHVIDWSKVK